MRKQRKVFTPDEANKTLPYVGRVVKDIVDTQQQISEVYSRLCKLVDEGCRSQAEELEGTIRGLLECREKLVDEIEQVGCEFKDYQLGLVDFPARIGKRTVYLCWRMGEPEVQFWHELHDGFAGRQPIDGQFANAADHSVG